MRLLGLFFLLTLNGGFWLVSAAVLAQSPVDQGTAIAAEEAQKKADYESRIKALKQNIKALKQDLKSVIDERKSLEGRLEMSESEISELLKQVKGIKKQIQEKNQQLQKLKNQQSSLTKAKREQSQAIANAIENVYRTGPQSQLKLVLNQEDPAKVMRMLKYHHYLLDARTQKIDGYRKTLASLDRLSMDIEKKNTNSSRKNSY